MNKLFCLAFAFLFLSISLISALDIGYVVRTPTSLDVDEQAVVNFLNAEGHVVTLLDDDTSFSGSDYRIVIVGGDVFDIGNKFDHTDTRTLFMSNSAAKKKGFSSSSGIGSDRNVRIEVSEGITENFSLLSSLQVYDNQDDLGYLSGCLAANSVNLVSKSSIVRPIILTLDVDSLLIGSSCNNKNKQIFERNVYFGLTDANSWNSNAEELFRRTIDWLDDPDRQPPVIESFSPSEVIEVVENTDTTFNVVYSDADNFDEVDVVWEIDGQVVSFGATYIFNEAVGVYDVVAVVDDERVEVQQDWLVTVVEASTLQTCSDLGGNICSVDEVCSGSILSSSESSCCSVTCTSDNPEFNRANTCSVKDSHIDIDFINVASGRNIEIGEDAFVTLRIRNDFSDDKSFDVDIHLYDLTDDKTIEKDNDKISIKDDENGLVAFRIDIDPKLDADHDYAFLVVVDDGECNQEFVRVNLDREDNEVVIDRVEIDQSELICGDTFNLEVYLENVGNDDQDIYVKVTSPKLKIDEKTEGFELERFGDDDSERVEFSLEIPPNAMSGDYTIRNEIFYGNHRDYSNKIITLAACGDESVEVPSGDILLGSSNINDLDTTRLGAVSITGLDNVGGTAGSASENAEGDTQEEDLGTNGGSSFFRNIFLVLLIVFAGVAGFVVYNFSQN